MLSIPKGVRGTASAGAEVPDGFDDPRYAYTKHAGRRAQQRAIPPHAVDLVVRFGRLQYHKGAEVYSVNKKARDAIRSHLGPIGYRAVEQHLDIYVVMGLGGIVTVAHRLDRLINA